MTGLLDRTLRDAARRFGDRVALVASDGWYVSYASLDGLADEIAAWFGRQGYGPGAVLALLLPSSPDYPALYLGAARAGLTTVGVNPRASAPQRTAALTTVTPDIVIGTEDLLDGVDRGPAQTIPIPLAAAPGDIAPFRLRGARAPDVPADPERPVAIVLTSGTTGPPKGAVFTDRQLDAIRRIDVGDARGPGGPMLSATELVHIGNMTKLAWYLRLGMTIHLLRRWRPGDALRVIAEERIPTLGGVSAQVALLLAAPEVERYDLSCVERLVIGGGPSPPALVDRARQVFGAPYSIRYSSTESGGVGTATAFDAPDAEALHTVGRPRDGVEVEVRDGAGRRLGPDEVGDVWLRSGAVMAGYWRDAEATADTLVDGWLRTRDLGRWDAHGCLVIVGRADDVYIRGGYNVHPQAVEAVLSAHPDVAAVAVVGVPDEMLGEIGAAVVVPRDPVAPPSLEDLRNFAASSLARHELPERLAIVEELPQTTMQKLDRRRLRSELG